MPGQQHPNVLSSPIRPIEAEPGNPHANPPTHFNNMIPEILELIPANAQPTVIEVNIPNVNHVPNVFGCSIETFRTLLERPDVKDNIAFRMRMPNNRVMFQIRDGHNLFCLTKFQIDAPEPQH